jgi:antitoxin component of MazEF toxin-antitoxin module
MAMQSQKNKNIRKLIKLAGKSLVVSLPMEYVEELKWKAKQKVVVTKKGRHLIIKDWKA